MTTHHFLSRGLSEASHATGRRGLALRDLENKETHVDREFTNDCM